MNNEQLLKLRSMRPTTREGRRAQASALSYLENIRTREDAMRVLQDIGLFNEDGSPNPYFYPDAATDEEAGN